MPLLDLSPQHKILVPYFLIFDVLCHDKPNIRAEKWLRKAFATQV